MSDVPSRRTHVAAAITLLEGAGLTVGDGEKPAGGGWAGTPGQSAFTPYVVVYDLGGTIDGTLANADEDGVIVLQASCIGPNRDAAARTADTVRTTLLAQTLTVTGRKITRVEVDLVADIRRDDDQRPPLFQADDRYAIHTVP